MIIFYCNFVIYHLGYKSFSCYLFLIIGDDSKIKVMPKGGGAGMSQISLRTGFIWKFYLFCMLN